MSSHPFTHQPHATDGDNPGVIVRPPRLYVVALALGLAIEFLMPSSFLELTWLEPHQRIVGIAVAACGFVLMSLSMMEFRKAGTNVPTNMPVHAIVNRGPYALSRNPIYIALTLIYLGIATTAKSAWALGFLVPVLLIMRYGVIAREEIYLARKFGDAYLDYRKKVGRWL